MSVQDFLLFESLNSEPYPYQEEVKYSGMDHIYTFSEGEHDFKLHFEKQANLGKNIYRAYVGQRTGNVKAFKKIVTRFKDANKVAATLVAIIGDFLLKYKSKTDGIAFALPIAAFGNYSSLVNKVIARKFLSQLNLVDSDYQPPEYKDDGLHYVYYTIKPKSPDVFNGKYVKDKLFPSVAASSASAKQPDAQSAPAKPADPVTPAPASVEPAPTPKETGAKLASKPKDSAAPKPDPKPAAPTPAVLKNASSVGLSAATQTIGGKKYLRVEYTIGSNHVFSKSSLPIDVSSLLTTNGYAVTSVYNHDNTTVYVAQKHSSNISDQLLTTFGFETLKATAATATPGFTSSAWTFATDDYQRRNGNYPRSGIPDTIEVYPEYVKPPAARPQSATFAFKNTSIPVATAWVKKFMDAQHVKYDRASLAGYQTGDYDDDWVEVSVYEFPQKEFAAARLKNPNAAPTPKQTGAAIHSMASASSDLQASATAAFSDVNAASQWVIDNKSKLKWTNIVGGQAQNFVYAKVGEGNVMLTPLVIKGRGSSWTIAVRLSLSKKGGEIAGFEKTFGVYSSGDPYKNDLVKAAIEWASAFGAKLEASMFVPR